jgi:hypothetical protein
VIRGHSRGHRHNPRPAAQQSSASALGAFQAGHEGSIPFARSIVMSQDIEDTLNPHGVRGVRRLGPGGLPVGW